MSEQPGGGSSGGGDGGGDDGDGGGSMKGLIIFILIFGVGNLILYKTTGIFLIPIPRK